MKIEIVAWDLNGVIVDDVEICLAAFNETLANFGCSQICINQFRQRYDIPFDDLWRGSGVKPELVNSKLYYFFRQAYEARLGDLRIRKFTHDCLAFLVERGVCNILLTNMDTEQVQKVLRQFGLLRYFEIVFASEGSDATSSRSKGEKLKWFLNQYKHNPNRVIIVGDTVEEVDISQEIGILSVAIDGGYHHRERLAAAKPSYHFSCLSELLDLFQSF